ncbi:hypothetical protein ABMA27_005722 [Loxostege sticticalis]|uniref:MD-2-related lipid-recognition domain-containing protein n=1 Tax=Loxostege sticticalis TaxID=481309 RepID=A0ABR3HK51_LOXSC
MESQSYGVGKLAFCNKKYFSYCDVVTTPRFVDGVERLFTNHTVTNIVTLGNNFTMAGVFVSQKGVQYKLEHRLCDYLKRNWMKTYLKAAGLKLPCPVPPGTYHFNDLELPPSDAPLAMLPGTYLFEGEMYTTVSKERAVGVHYTIHFSDSFKRKKKNMKKNKGE